MAAERAGQATAAWIGIGRVRANPIRTMPMPRRMKRCEALRSTVFPFRRQLPTRQLIHRSLVDSDANRSDAPVAAGKYGQVRVVDLNPAGEQLAVNLGFLGG